MAEIQLRKPPRLSGEPPASQLSNIGSYMEDLYRAQLATLQVLDMIGKLGVLGQIISNPPTQAEVAALQDKVNAIVILARQIEL